MTTRAEMIGSGPGTATIRVLGSAIRPPVEAFQIQRNQMPDAYLAPDVGWQTSPDYWIALKPGDVFADANGLSFSIGPSIVDPLVTALTRSTFRLCLRAGGKTSALALSAAAQAPLLSSGAKARGGLPPIEHTPQRPAPQPVEPPTPDVPPIKPEPILPPVPPVRKSRVGLIAIIAILILLSAGAAAAWFYRDTLMAMFGVGEETPGEDGATALSLREELKQFMDTNPSAEAIIEKANVMAAEGKAEGTVFLFRQAIDKGSMDAAVALGKVYDPTEPANANSTTTSVETASFWYAKAANANIAEAQRRLGLLQVRNGPGSATFDLGVENLKKARNQGDSTAADKLKELGQ
jgi:hypothetical protein